MNGPKVPIDPTTGKRKKTGGRKAGVPNRATADARKAIAELLEMAAPQMIQWLERVAHDDPAKALDLVFKAAEYHIPKLARTEVSGDPSNPLYHEHRTRYDMTRDELLAIAAQAQGQSET